MISASILLAALGVTDIFRGSDASPTRFGPSALRGLIVAAGVALAITWSTDISGIWAAFGIVIAAAWIYLSSSHAAIHQRLAIPLIGAALAIALLLGPKVDLTRYQTWFGSLNYPFVALIAPERLMLSLAIALVLISTTNIAVKLVIASAESTRGSSKAVEDRDMDTLKGGRLIGPMERFLIVGLSISGQFVAVGGLLAAKGIVRFPEISKSKDTGQQAEYFLVGTLASWLVALMFAALLML